MEAERICRAVGSLSPDDVEVNATDRQVWLTDAGIEKMRTLTGIDNLFDAVHADTLARIQSALEARHLVRRDKDYIVKDGCVQIVDEDTGRVTANRKFPDLLQQAVETLENVAQAPQTMVYNVMSMQAFLKQYRRLCGMTGTAATSAAVFQSMYGLEVDVIPPHVPCMRMDHEDAVFPDAASRMAALLASVCGAHGKGQPVLVGTLDVRASEQLSDEFARLQLPHRILNARNDEEEAAIIAEAGRPGRITISTNMAGRGVDIRLGGGLAEEAEMVRKAGGLYIVGTGINRSLRVDNQLRGRAGRQGDPGESRFFVNLADLVPETDRMPASGMLTSGMSGSEISGSKMSVSGMFAFGRPASIAHRIRRAQRDMEGRDAEGRYMLERYSEVQEEKRHEVTAYRTALLRGARSPGILDVQAPDLRDALITTHGAPAVSLAERQLTLHFINRHWADFLSALEDKRSGVHLEVVAGGNPLDAYQRFVAEAYGEMQADLRADVVDWMRRCTITENGVDLEAEGLSGATTTWTYLIAEGADQFSRIPHLIRTTSNAIRGTLFSLRGLVAGKRRRND